MRALIITSDQFEDSELQVPLAQLRAAGVAVDIAAPTPGPIRGKHGHIVTATLSVAEVDPDRYDGVILPGGKAPASLREHPAVRDVIRRAAANGSALAAICHGPQILVDAGVLRDRQATGHAGISQELRQAGANYVDEEVVIDGNVITSRKPADLPAFVSAILNALNVRAQRRRA